jgi:hypothetical protein
MALSPNFSCSQNAGTPSTFTIQDTSTGSDGSVTQRRVYLLQADGTYLVPSGVTTNYIEWPIANSTISLNVLNQDTALEITVQWLNVSNAVLYDKTQAFGFDAFGQSFYYGLTQTQVPIINPQVALSTNYYYNKMVLRVLLDSAAQAISYASDIYSAQVCYDSETQMINNANYYF